MTWGSNRGTEACIQEEEWQTRIVEEDWFGPAWTRHGLRQHRAGSSQPNEAFCCLFPAAPSPSLSNLFSEAVRGKGDVHIFVFLPSWVLSVWHKQERKQVLFSVTCLNSYPAAAHSDGGCARQSTSSSCVALWKERERPWGDGGGWHTMQCKQHLNLWDDRLSSFHSVAAAAPFSSPPVSVCILTTASNNTYWCNQSYLCKPDAMKVSLSDGGFRLLFSLSLWGEKGLSPDQIFP